MSERNDFDFDPEGVALGDDLEEKESTVLEGEALGDNLEPALDDIEENPDELVGEEVEGEYDPDYEEES